MKKGRGNNRKRLYLGLLGLIIIGLVGWFIWQKRISADSNTNVGSTVLLQDDFNSYSPGIQSNFDNWVLVGNNPLPYIGDENNVHFDLWPGLQYRLYGDKTFHALYRKFDDGKNYSIDGSTTITTQFDFTPTFTQTYSEVRFVLMNSAQPSLFSAVGVYIRFDEAKRMSVWVGMTQEKGEDRIRGNASQKMTLPQKITATGQVTYRIIFTVVNGTVTASISDDKALLGQGQISRVSGASYGPFDSFGVTNYSDGRNERINPTNPGAVTLTDGSIDNLVVRKSSCNVLGC